MRPGVPDRRADARARGRHDRRRQDSGVGVPVLRRRLPAHLPRQGQRDPLRAGQGRPGELEPAVRQGPLRLRLRAAPAPPHHAAHPQAGHAESTRTSPSIRTTGATSSAKPAGKRRSTSPPTGLRDIRDTYGKQSLAGFGSAKGTNEEAYLFQKLVRTGFGSNNVDHCTRLCHASSVAALMEGINSGAVSNQVRDVAKAEVIFVIGANPTVNHPVAATWMKNAAKAGAKLIVADPRRERSGAACHLLSPVQSRHRRRAAERDAARHRRGGPGRRGVRPRSHLRLRRARREREEVLARGDGADLRHRRADDPRGRPAVCHVEGLDDPVGHGDLAARARHRQRALPDRAGALDRPDRQARLGAAPAARPEQRAGRVRLRADSDVLSRLPARGHAGGAGSASRRCGARRSIRSRASPSSRS